MTRATKKITATAKCASFDIDLNAVIKTKGLAANEVEDIQRKLRQGVADVISKLPFAHVYSHEVRVR